MEKVVEFIPSDRRYYEGEEGEAMPVYYVFKSDAEGLGYYYDHLKKQREQQQ